MDHFHAAHELYCMADRQVGVARSLNSLADEAALGCLDRSIKIHALVENREKVLDNLNRLEFLAQKTGTDIRMTVHFINQWLAGEAADAICR